jgi:hypothetical protein
MNKSRVSEENTRERHEGKEGRERHEGDKSRVSEE